MKKVKTAEIRQNLDRRINLSNRRYRQPRYQKSTIDSSRTVEGETIEMKVRRLIENNEPVKDGAPEIFTERKDGVLPAYDVRTDRWEIATEAMDKVTADRRAKAEGITPMKVVKNDEGKGKESDGGAEPTHGKESSKNGD